MLLALAVCGACLQADETGHALAGELADAESWTWGEPRAFQTLTALVVDLGLTLDTWRQLAPQVDLAALIPGAGGDTARVPPVHLDDPVSPPLSTTQEVACEGSMTISDDVSYAAAAMCTTITGSLTVDPAFSDPEISLPQLASVGGDIQVWNTVQLASLDMPLLRSIGNNFIAYYNQNLSYLTVPLLCAVGRDTFIEFNPQLPSFETLGGSPCGKTTPLWACPCSDQWTAPRVEPT